MAIMILIIRPRSCLLQVSTWHSTCSSKVSPDRTGSSSYGPRSFWSVSHFLTSKHLSDISIRNIRHHLQYSPNSRRDFIRNLAIRRPKGRRIRYKPLFRPECPKSRISTTSSILGDLYRFPRSSYLASESNDQEPPFGREAIWSIEMVLVGRTCRFCPPPMASLFPSGRVYYW